MILTYLAWTALTLGMAARCDAQTVSLRNQMPPIRHQGYNRNTCSAFAATAVFEWHWRKHSGESLDLSEEWVYWKSREGALNGPLDNVAAREAYRRVDGQAGFRALLPLLTWTPLQEAAWPYGGLAPHSLLSSLTPAVPDFEILSIPLERASAHFLSAHPSPLIVNLRWIPAAVTTRGHYQLPTHAQLESCARPEGRCGGHVVVLIGYDPTTRRLEFRNSWGANWGEGGYGWIDEEALTLHCEVCASMRAGRSLPEWLSLAATAVGLKSKRTQ